MKPPFFPAADPSRRRFVKGIALGGAAVGFGLLRSSNVWAATRPPNVAGANHPHALSGTDFTLDIAEAPVNFTGRARVATTVNGGVPGPILRWKEGTTITLRVTNHLQTPTSVHWHGILLPFEMDGVPGISYPGIAPGETFVYRFPVKQSGTYWYHSHSRFQEQNALYGSIVIEPAGPERYPSDRDYVVMLNDWSDDDPEHIYATLKRQSDYYNFAEPTAPEFFHDVRELGLQKALAKRSMWNQMRMSPSDLSDVSGYTYTYLMNGHAPAANWTGLFRPGEKIRLRFINGSAMSLFDVRIPGLKMTVIAADGQDVEPVLVDEFRISVAETYDVLVEPQEDRAYTIFAASIDRTGYARGTLTPREGLQAEVPAMDPRQRLAMVDMMGAMAMGGAGGHGGHGDAHDMSGMHGMGKDDAAMEQTVKAHHARTEYGPGVDMRVDMPRTNIDDPGVGLRDNGRRVLTYADLHTIGGPIDNREPSREIEMHLTGNMNRYMWSFDGHHDAAPDSHARHVERAGKLRWEIPGAQTHHQCAAGAANHLRRQC